MNLVDSSGWLEYLTDAPGADFFAPAIEDLDHLVVPQICMVEVVRRIYRERGDLPAVQALAQMKRGRAIVLTDEIILSAARLARKHRLPLADSMILATGRAYGAIVWTQDSDFEGLEGVKYTPKRHPASQSLNERSSVRSYDLAKASGDEAIPFERAIEEIEGGGG